MPLNRDQARIVATRLRLLEQELAEIERLLDGDEVGSLYRRTRPSRSDEQRSAMTALLSETRGRLAALADRFGLPQEDQDARRRILGMLATTWESLGEVDAKHLGAYGTVDPDVSSNLDPAVRELMTLLLRLRRLVSDAAAPEDGPGH